MEYIQKHSYYTDEAKFLYKIYLFMCFAGISLATIMSSIMNDFTSLRTFTFSILGILLLISIVMRLEKKVYWTKEKMKEEKRRKRT